MTLESEIKKLRGIMNKYVFSFSGIDGNVDIKAKKIVLQREEGDVVIKRDDDAVRVVLPGDVQDYSFNYNRDYECFVMKKEEG